MPKNKSCGYSVTHVTCGTNKFVLEHLGYHYYALHSEHYLRLAKTYPFQPVNY